MTIFVKNMDKSLYFKTIELAEMFNINNRSRAFKFALEEFIKSYDFLDNPNTIVYFFIDFDKDSNFFFRFRKYLRRQDIELMCISDISDDISRMILSFKDISYINKLVKYLRYKDEVVNFRVVGV